MLKGLKCSAMVDSSAISHLSRHNKTSFITTKAQLYENGTERKKHNCCNMNSAALTFWRFLISRICGRQAQLLKSCKFISTSSATVQHAHMTNILDTIHMQHSFRDIMCVVEYAPKYDRSKLCQLQKLLEYKSTRFQNTCLRQTNTRT